jgi:hypothetical protein
MMGIFFDPTKDPIREFKVYLRRQGWTVTQTLTQESDPQVLRFGRETVLSLPDELFTFLERKTTRKLLRALMTGPQARETLLRICRARFVSRELGQAS